MSALIPLQSSNRAAVALQLVKVRIAPLFEAHGTSAVSRAAVPVSIRLSIFFWVNIKKHLLFQSTPALQGSVGPTMESLALHFNGVIF